MITLHKKLIILYIDNALWNFHHIVIYFKFNIKWNVRRKHFIFGGWKIIWKKIFTLLWSENIKHFWHNLLSTLAHVWWINSIPCIQARDITLCYFLEKSTFLFPNTINKSNGKTTMIFKLKYRCLIIFFVLEEYLHLPDQILNNSSSFRKENKLTSLSPFLL